MYRTLALCLLPASLHAVSFSEFTDPNPAKGNGFGFQVVPLTNGNVVVSAPGDDAAANNAGAIYLFNGATGALISTLRGSSPGDQVGQGAIVALPNGNFVAASPNWDRDGIADAGAVTLVNGSTGLNGTPSAANSLVGSSVGDYIGGPVPYMGEVKSIKVLANGNYVVASPSWNNGSVARAGAVTWCSATTPLTGPVGPDNSLVGSLEDDRVGGSQYGPGGIIPLPGGNYLVASPDCSNGSSRWTGAVTWGSGTAGVKGIVSVSNSLMGSANSLVGSGGVVILTNGNYVVKSPFWRKGTTADVGAVTWGNAATGVKGLVSGNNSLVGSKFNDQVGKHGVVALTNGNYVVASAACDIGTTQDAGAATWGNGTTGVKGAVSASNSMVGAAKWASIGFNVTPLSNGNYVVSSYLWSTYKGIVTWGNGATGTKGSATAANSLTGDTGAGLGQVTALANGNFVVNVPEWDSPTDENVGALAVFSGAGPVKGKISAAAALVGSHANDHVGLYPVTPLTNGNFVAFSPHWDNGSVVDAGAFTFCQGTPGFAGVVDATNSLVGSTKDDARGEYSRVSALSNGNYVVRTPYWDKDASNLDVGAVTWGSGTTGVSGPIGPANSLTGTLHQDEVGMIDIVPLTNGNFVVLSPRWNVPAWGDTGALTWVNGATGLSGPVSAANSLIGKSGSSRWPLNPSPDIILPLANGNYAVHCREWSYQVAAATLGQGSSGATGTFEQNPTVVVPIPFYPEGDWKESFVVADPVNHSIYASVPNANGGVVKVGSDTTGFTTPDIEVKQADGTLVTHGSLIDLGNLPLDPYSYFTFTIRNTGTGDLSLLNWVQLEGSAFHLEAGSADTLLSAGESATFTLSVHPYSPGLRQSTVAIRSNDAETPLFSFMLKATGMSYLQDKYHDFAAASFLSGEDAAHDATPHDDGIPNLLKFAFNMNGAGHDRRMLAPDTGTAGLPVFSTIQENGKHYFTVQYVRLRENGPTYVAKWSETLAPGSFVPMNGSMTTAWIDVNWQRVTITQEIDPAVNKQRFGIVEVTMP